MHLTRSRTPALLVAFALALALAAMVVPGLAAAQAPDAEIDVVNFAYQADDVTVPVGGTVRWDRVEGSHTVTADDGLFDEPVNGPNPIAEVTFTEPGVVEYFCEIHSTAAGTFMNGVIRVSGDAPPPEPTDPPTEPTDPPTEPTDPPTEPTDPGDNVAAALRWSAERPAGAGGTVLLARDDDFADSLASGGAQGILDAPLLLTTGGPDATALDPRVEDELARLGPATVLILGGEQAVSAAVATQLAGLGFHVERVAGATRLETAVGLAERYGADRSQVVIARAFGDAEDPTRGFADSLAAGAFAAQGDVPVLLTETGQLSQSTAEYLAASQVTTAVIAGGTAAVGEAVATALGAEDIAVQRIAGASRFETAVGLAASTGDPATAAPVVLVDGTSPDAWADGFPAALPAARGMMLAAGDALPMPTRFALFASGPAPICALRTAAAACAQGAALAGASVPGTAGTLTGVMDSGQEVPPVDSPASGVGFVVPTTGADALCYSFTAFALPPLAAAHIHQGPAGVDGDVVVPLANDATVSGLGTSVVGCALDLDPALVAMIFADPAGFYLNLHTATFPDGEVRGQLFEGRVLSANLDSGQEVPGPGDANASGTASVYLTGVADQVCVLLGVAGLDAPPTAAHIHQAPAGVAGDVVVTLPAPPAADSNVAGCVGGLDPALVTAIGADPGGFYVNVHTSTFPAGAVRGQLSA